MPVRPRNSRRPRHELTHWQIMVLDCYGYSSDPGEDVETLRALYEEHKRRFNDKSWCVQFFEHGIDEGVQVSLAKHDPADDYRLPTG